MLVIASKIFVMIIIYHYGYYLTRVYLLNYLFLFGSSHYLCRISFWEGRLKLDRGFSAYLLPISCVVIILFWRDFIITPLKSWCKGSFGWEWIKFFGSRAQDLSWVTFLQHYLKRLRNLLWAFCVYCVRGILLDWI